MVVPPPPACDSAPLLTTARLWSVSVRVQCHSIDPYLPSPHSPLFVLYFLLFAGLDQTICCSFGAYLWYVHLVRVFARRILEEHSKHLTRRCAPSLFTFLLCKSRQQLHRCSFLIDIPTWHYTVTDFAVSRALSQKTSSILIPFIFDRPNSHVRSYTATPTSTPAMRL